MPSNELLARYQADGYINAVPVISELEAAEHRRTFEVAERRFGPLHYLDKIHVLLHSPLTLATHPAVLDIVEALIGPNILLYNATYIVKEPGSEAHVAWHQDLTYWGLADDDAQASMWLAIAPATRESGCMWMVAGSHTQGAVAHATESSSENLLLKGQHVPDVDASEARVLELNAGEASFHHGWTLHSSPSNSSRDRRIGLNVQYLAPHNRLRDNCDASALLVRGKDDCGYFIDDVPAVDPITDDAVMRWRTVAEKMRANFQVA